jgi:seryl-tRNA synthetase
LKAALDEILEAGILTPSSVRGVYAFGPAFERVVGACASLITRLGAECRPEFIRFPPAMDQEILLRNGYFVGFPNLAGCIHSFAGGEEDHRRLVEKIYCDEPIDDEFTPTYCVMPPAACYPVYPLVADRGALGEAGVLFDVESYCFRREPSDDPTRMQTFRMREYVRVGNSSQTLSFRNQWLARAKTFVEALGLTGDIAAANDPFFGSRGGALGAQQLAKGLKCEMLVAIKAADDRTACMSFNCHETHFAGTWNIRLADGALAHTACVGFGMERLALALFATHGIDENLWPLAVRQALWTA